MLTNKIRQVGKKIYTLKNVKILLKLECWCVTGTPILGRLGQEDHMFKPSVCTLVRDGLKTKDEKIWIQS